MYIVLYVDPGISVLIINNQLATVFERITNYCTNAARTHKYKNTCVVRPETD